MSIVGNSADQRAVILTDLFGFCTILHQCDVKVISVASA